MRSILICLALAGCAVHESQPVSPLARDCVTLPTLKPGATTADMREHIGVLANLYARCAETP